MKVLVACEESQRVMEAFRARGHEAYSCDVLPSSGNLPQYHLQQDVLPLLSDPSWDLVIAHPPCTHLAVSGSRFFKEKQADGRQYSAVDFFAHFIDCPCPRVAIENPVGIISSLWRKPDQIVQPYWFGDSAQKATCLWLKGLPPLRPTNMVEPGKTYTTPNGSKVQEWYGLPKSPSGKYLRWGDPETKRIRSRTFRGTAAAMAEQWGVF